MHMWVSFYEFSTAQSRSGRTLEDWNDLISHSFTGLTLDAVAGEYRPNYLCNYLYELAGHFARFYENCPVLKAAESDRASRLVLCNLTAQVLKEGLGVLGIETTEQM